MKISQTLSLSLSALPPAPQRLRETYDHRRHRPRPPTEMAEGGAPPAVSAADVEAKLRVAMVSRVSYFKEQADSLTFEGVRRLMEKDLGLDTYALDVHKRIVKQCLQECLEPASKDEDGMNPGDVGEIVSEVDAEREYATEPEKESKEPDSKGGDEMEDSPVMGLMAASEKSKSKTKGVEGNGNTVPTEAVIKKAISRRAPHFRKNAETITMGGARRLLEEDLKLDKFALDPFKKLISEEVNEILSVPQVSRSATGDKKRRPRKSSEAESSTSSKESDIEEDDVKPRRKPASKGKSKNLSGLKKRKQAGEAVKEKNKKIKPSKVNSDSSGEDGDDSRQENSESSAEMPMKKKDVPKPSYSRRVENLKSVIKSCGMSIPPIIYKKVKQAPESKREAALIKELEDILAKEGLSANPSEKEIKEVKKRKDRAKELEGIDMSNIVTSSRRRSTFSFAPPPKPKEPVESPADSGESSDDEDEDEEEEEEEEVEEEEGAGEEQDEEEDGNESKSEENEDDGDADSD